MIHTYTYGDLVWVDVASPSQGEITDLIKKYDIYPAVGEELLSSQSEPRVELYKNCVYLTLDIPSRAGRAVIKKEIDFVVGNKFIITTKYDTVEPLHNFSRIFETNSILDKKGMGKHAGFIFYYMLKKIYQHVGRDLNNIKDGIMRAEVKIFAGDEKNMVKELSQIGREILDAKQILRSHKEVLELVGIAFEKLFGQSFRYYTDDLTAEYEKIHSVLENLHDLLRELRTTNDSLLSTKQNETMKILTMMAFITFPLSLVTDLFSMNTSHAPIVGHSFDFEIILAIMILLALSLFGFFKYKKWL